MARVTPAVAEDIFASNGHLPVEDSWAPVDLVSLLASIESGEVQGPTPALLPRTDGVCLLYPGELHSLSGEPEAGKGLLAIAEAVRLLPFTRVLWLDFEDSAVNVITRALAFGASPADIAARFVYVRPEETLQPGRLEALLDGDPYALAVLDGQSEAYSLLGLDSYSNSDIPTFLRVLARPIAATGAAVVLIDHVVKDKATRGRFALGGIHKLAGVAVAYGVEAIDPPSRTRAGTLKLTVHKDRHGHVRGHAASGTIALVRVEPDETGDHVTVTVDPPDSTTAAGGFRPTVLMERVSQYVQGTPGATNRDVRSNVKGTKHDAKDTALAVLIREGYIDVKQDGRARRHYSIRPYSDDSDHPDRAHVPDRAPTVPGTPESDRAHVPPPTGGTGTTRSPQAPLTVPHSQDQGGERR